MMKAIQKCVCLLTLTCLLLISTISTASASPKVIEQKVTLYYPNGDWGLTPVETVLSVSDKDSLYLAALQELADPKALPTGCYDEFPESFKVKEVRIHNNTAYVTISDAFFKDPELSDGWLNVLGDIIAYNLFNLNHKIDTVEFLSSPFSIRGMNSVRKSDLFKAPISNQKKDIPPKLELDINVLKKLPENERHKMIQEAINKALGIQSSSLASSSAVFKVCIDPGHGGSDPGAVVGDVHESDLNLNIALAARNYLVSVPWPTFEVLMTRESDVYRSLEYRYNLANNNNADIFISIHCNATSDSSIRGCEAFYADNHDVAASESLGNALIRGVVEFSSIPKRSDAKCVNYIVLKYTTMPASLIECGFMTNSSDLWALQNEDDDIGYGIGLEANFWCQANL